MNRTTKVGRKRDDPQRKAVLGKRLRVAAEQAGYKTTVAMGEALGLPNSTISRWWNGLQTPNLEEMARYAECVGKRPWWFYVEAGAEDLDYVAEALMEIVGLAMGGADLADAHQRVTGEAARFGHWERAVLAGATDSLRGQVTRELAGGAWEQQPPARRRQIVERLAAQALAAEEADGPPERG